MLVLCMYGMSARWHKLICFLLIIHQLNLRQTWPCILNRCCNHTQQKVGLKYIYIYIFFPSPLNSFWCQYGHWSATPPKRTTYLQLARLEYVTMTLRIWQNRVGRNAFAYQYREFWRIYHIQWPWESEYCGPHRWQILFGNKWSWCGGNCNIYHCDMCWNIYKRRIGLLVGPIVRHFQFLH